MTVGCDYQDLLRLPQPARAALLRQLDEREVTAAERELRKHDRHSYRVSEGLAVQFEREGSSPAKFIVTPRDISAGGVSFLHGSFVYPGMTCVMALRTIGGEHVVARGGVVRCRCVHGRVHEVAVRFETEIEIENFVVLETVETDSDAIDEDRSRVVELADRVRELARGNAPVEELESQVMELASYLRQPGERTG